MPTASAQIIGSRYRVVKRLGGGGQKTVYLAEDLRLSRRSCALAEMVDNFADPQEQSRAIAAFEREADILAALKEDNIPQIYDKFSEGQKHYLVMEFVEGDTLENRISSAGGSLPELEVIDIAIQVLDTLQYLHAHNPPIIYRDMKPGNVMVTPAGRVKLIDFGIARLFQSGRMTTFGTVGYAPKEQYSGMVEPRSDLYALGATLHEALSGRAPIPFDFPPLSQLRPGCNRALSNLLSQVLLDDIDARIPTAREFRSRLLAIRTAATTLSGGHARQQSASNDPTVQLQRTRAEADSETLPLTSTPSGAGRLSGRNISMNRPAAGTGSSAIEGVRRANDRNALADMEETVPLAAFEERTAKLGDRSAIDTTDNKPRRKATVFIALASAAVLTIGAGAGAYVWNQAQQKAAMVAHEKAMEQLEERQREVAEQEQMQRQQEEQREREIQQQQEALRQQAESQRRAEASLRRQQRAEARRERESEQASRGAYANYPPAAEYPSPNAGAYPPPNAPANSGSDMSGALASGLSAAIGGALGNSVGDLISGSSAGATPGYTPPNYPRHPRQGR